MHQYRHKATGGLSSSYGLEAADELGLPPEQVFKTLVVSVDGNLTVAIVPVAAQLNLRHSRTRPAASGPNWPGEPPPSGRPAT